MTALLKTILCIDDEEDILQIEKLTLESLGGFTAHVCSDGRLAQEKATALKPDLILLDVMMPDIDGPSVLAELRANDSLATIPIIFMTARAQPNEIEEYKALGAIGVITKPFDPVRLCSEILSLWNQQYG